MLYFKYSFASVNIYLPILLKLRNLCYVANTNVKISCSIINLYMKWELLGVYNRNMTLMGRMIRIEAHRTGAIHKAFHCWIADNNSLYFQLRSKDQEFSGMLDVTAGEHLKSGDPFQKPRERLKKRPGSRSGSKNYIIWGRTFLIIVMNQFVLEKLGKYIYTIYQMDWLRSFLIITKFLELFLSHSQ